MVIDFIPAGRASALVAALLACVAGTGPAEAATTVFQLDIRRTSADQEAPTFSGRGRLAFETTDDDFSVDAPSDLSAFFLEVTTLGSLGEEADPVAFTFNYGLEDVLSAEGIEPSSDPNGSIALADKASQGGEVTLTGVLLDFGRDRAQGFCYPIGDALAECVRGGGTSTFAEARFFQELGPAPIPLPATLPLALTALGGLAAWGSRSRRARPA